MLPNQNFSKHL